jgi:hypothetical protein
VSGSGAFFRNAVLNANDLGKTPSRASAQTHVRGYQEREGIQVRLQVWCPTVASVGTGPYLIALAGKRKLKLATLDRKLDNMDCTQATGAWANVEVEQQKTERSGFRLEASIAQRQRRQDKQVEQG